jgi:hypothetical protein
MVVIRTPDGATVEYRLRRTANGLRLELRCASYDLATMVLEAGLYQRIVTDLDALWRAVGLKAAA